MNVIASIWKCLRNDEQNWRQNSRIKWLLDGDKNSRFFHSISNMRRNYNFLGDLAFDGVVYSNPSSVGDEVFNYFQNHFKNHFKEEKWFCPRIIGLQFNHLSVVESETLEEKFTHDQLEERHIWGFLVKLDFEKSCDNIDHNFLDSVKEGTSFGVIWENWISNCISSPTLSLLVNGSPMKEFSLE
ncbi:hypothetical protein Ddye_023094 [Dipteronia dyeriana]|uniref:Reverse transcriptase n=1 Tax=Dipteronia dyeriana TaxID=168575 RepID=A0AAD9TSX1_9ROSI|nr:hypothetical protein Ddye_023094 [Dipteronia dyeriana]